ncbi:(d)CMP kinase [Treponema brennaborense]|uniref:Cytidylate kinase n=1 Tax=Treponema brennaborense (strain DSM 12168 / CIP 105900 / DD5/3) TaxID=906968 RepID=F4LP91_TREBD|nr:cytidylate kinase family protein [Treponema brennaborense]AEE16953.1 Cytidylate kinase [Treponema brennaborense DSM 12168]
MNYAIPAGKKVRIAISGKSGCGNTTVCTLLSEKLGVPMINFTFRSLAAETGLSLAEIIERAKTDDGFDRAVDTRQIELAMRDSCVLGSRLAVWMLKAADLKVYLIADDEVRAARIFKREGGDIEQIKAFTRMRDGEDTGRYKRLYGIDNNDYGFCDMKIDTANHDPERIADLILTELCRRELIVPRG